MSKKSEYQLTRAEKFKSWHLGWRDGRRYVDPKVEENLITSSISSLVSQRYARIMEINEDFHIRLKGFADTLNQVDGMKIPPENHEVGQAGREWHAYTAAKNQASLAAEGIVQIREQYNSKIQAHRYCAESIMNIYAGTLKRYHPRKDLLVNWFPELPNFEISLIYVHPSIEEAVARHLNKRGRSE